MHRHRLLYQARLACGRNLERKLAMARWRGRDIDRVNLRVPDEIFSAGVHAGDVVPACVIFGLRMVSTHHRDERRTLGLVERRPAFHFGHVAAADHAPSDCFHGWWFVVSRWW